MKLTELDQSEAIRYLGYGSQKPDAKILALLNDCEKKLLECISPAYVYRVFDIAYDGGAVAVEGTSLKMEGGDICKHLEKCGKCVLMCATLSAGADRLIRRLEAEDMTEAVITDCLASAAVEQVCNMAEEEIKSELDDCFFTWRFSPGYGDFPIGIQKDFLEVLNAPKRIGVNSTESMILTPRKSVTAVMGISDTEIPKGRRGCVTCKLREKCIYRRKGERCGF
ncbi:vitamin B12 dependent-methionine synthase activation domain-containing protein [Ruminococcus sp. Marseille-P6503]|uniref:vitamin B12 dependent-methionine synthase activation domain-containing protein n=1 Tax=Ruminococcus sp. Marseille-P6503 TaxID=2364796 RepID=UPI000F52C340|nr:vitamin B12 dependent-methionine synthase activation domain-containing protein [Ruminococcus sp. Marseille-P6503]